MRKIYPRPFDSQTVCLVERLPAPCRGELG